MITILSQTKESRCAEVFLVSVYVYIYNFKVLRLCKSKENTQWQCEVVNKRSC